MAATNRNATTDSNSELLDAVLIDHGYAVTVTGRPGIYRYACSCGSQPAVVISRNPAVALKVAVSHLGIHKPIAADDNNDGADVFRGLS